MLETQPEDHHHLFPLAVKCWISKFRKWVNREVARMWDVGLGLTLPKPGLSLQKDAGQRAGDVGYPDLGWTLSTARRHKL